MLDELAGPETATADCVSQISVSHAPTHQVVVPGNGDAFEKNGIAYRILDGKAYVRASSVVNQVFPWTGWQTDKAELGTRCHAWLEAWHRGERLPTATAEMFKRLWPLTTWFRGQKYKPLLIEHTSKHESLNYCGTMDLVAVYENGQAYIDDYKFSDFTEVPHRYVLQMCAYGKLPEGRGLKPRLIQVTCKGEVKVHQLKVEQEHWRVFKHALEITKWRLGL